MKYLKTYEQNKTLEPNVGDYVICEDSFFSNKDGAVDFINNTIGQIVKVKPTASMIYDKTYEVEYKNIPKNLASYFEFDNDVDDKYTGILFTRRKEIIHFSPDKKRLETILLNKKYNI